MNTENITIVKITPSEGNYLTQANLKEDEPRIFSTEVYLGIHDAPENWIEWTAEQKAEYEAALEAEKEAEERK